MEAPLTLTPENSGSAAHEDRVAREEQSAHPRAISVGAQATGAQATGARTIGALAVGAIALGALAIGGVAFGRLVMCRARFGRREIDELVVRDLRIARFEE